jgi:hypothetical protein
MSPDDKLLPSPWDRIVARLRSSLKTGLTLEYKLDELKLNQGLILTALNATKTSRQLQDYEFRVFSQWGEDGIIQKLVATVDVAHRTFIEFGAEDFKESNCRFLMSKDNWSGFVMDGSPRNVRRLNSAATVWRHDIRARAAFITRENINELLASSGFDADLGLLSIDIDGVDYHVLERIEHYRPRILVLEYNPIFGAERAITVPYEADFYRTAKHHSNMYFGASLAALTHLAQRKGYALVGTTSSGVNAFYVRRDLLTDRLPELDARTAFTNSKLRESKGPDGRPTLVGGAARLALIRGMPVVNVLTGAVEPL